MPEEKYNIYVPIDIQSSIEKSNEDSEGDWYVRGYATTPDLDLQNDIIDPRGIDISYFVKNGWVNAEHNHDTDHIVGVPTENCFVNLDQGLFVEAKLFKDNKNAQEMWALAESIQKSGVNRSLGFSIEGAVKSRSSSDNRVIEGVIISNVALTTHPANPNATWETLVKSWSTGYGITPDTQNDASALRREMFGKEITDLTHSVRTMTKFYALPKDIQNFIVKSAAADLDRGNALEHTEKNEDMPAVMLQLAKGISFEDAKRFLNQ